MATQISNNKMENLCLKLFEIGALKFGDFKMKVGLNSPVYFDLRVVVSYPSLMNSISDLIFEKIKSEELNAKLICGVPYTALPFSTLVAVKSNQAMLIRRKEPKKYGTMKLIEGSFNPGDTCLIIEDVVTSGSSILETAKDLRHDGLVVSDVVVILDREQGGTQNLENNGIQMHCLLTLAQVLEILHSLGKINKNTVEQVQEYIHANQILPNGELIAQTVQNDRSTMTFGERASLATCELSSRIFHLMESKKTNLCVAVDVTSSGELLNLIEDVGEYCAVIKTHYDAVLDWSSETEKSLRELSKKHNFIIIEDRKFADIGNTLKLQMKKVETWADAVTAHSIPGPSFIPHSPLPLFLLAQMSSAANLLTDSYTQATLEMAESNKKNIVGIVCRDGNILKYPGFVQLFPGVSFQSGGDGLGQQYITPEEAVCISGGDLIVVGRAIYLSPNPKEAASEIRDRLWNAYTKRISQTKYL